MKRIITYLLITFCFSWLFWGVGYLSQEDYLHSIFGLFRNLAIFGPLVGFLVINKLDGKSNKSILRNLIKLKSKKWLYWFAILSPLTLSSLAYLIVIFVNKNTFQLGLSIQMIIPVALIILLVGGPVEEFGWRGILQPAIRDKFGVIGTTLIVGLIHGIWHLPLHYLEGSVQIEIPVFEFILITILITFTYTFMYEYSKGFKNMLIFHWISNLSSAIFIYWDSSEGRYYFLILVVIYNLGLYTILMMKKNNQMSYKS